MAQDFSGVSGALIHILLRFNNLLKPKVDKSGTVSSVTSLVVSKKLSLRRVLVDDFSTKVYGSHCIL